MAANIQKFYDRQRPDLAREHINGIVPSSIGQRRKSVRQRCFNVKSGEISANSLETSLDYSIHWQGKVTPITVNNVGFVLGSGTNSVFIKLMTSSGGSYRIAFAGDAGYYQAIPVDWYDKWVKYEVRVKDDTLEFFANGELMGGYTTQIALRQRFKPDLGTGVVDDYFLKDVKVVDNETGNIYTYYTGEQGAGLSIINSADAAKNGTLDLGGGTQEEFYIEDPTAPDSDGDRRGWNPVILSNKLIDNFNSENPFRLDFSFVYETDSSDAGVSALTVCSNRTGATDGFMLGIQNGALRIWAYGLGNPSVGLTPILAKGNTYRCFFEYNQDGVISGGLIDDPYSYNDYYLISNSNPLEIWHYGTTYSFDNPLYYFKYNGVEVKQNQAIPAHATNDRTDAYGNALQNHGQMAVDGKLTGSGCFNKTVAGDKIPFLMDEMPDGDFEAWIAWSDLDPVYASERILACINYDHETSPRPGVYWGFGADHLIRATMGLYTVSIPSSEGELPASGRSRIWFKNQSIGIELYTLGGELIHSASHSGRTEPMIFRGGNKPWVTIGTYALTSDISSSSKYTAKIFDFRFTSFSGDSSKDLYWPLTHHSGLLAQDVSGNNNHGTVNLNGAADGTQWGEQDVYHYAESYGEHDDALINTGKASGDHQPNLLNWPQFTTDYNWRDLRIDVTFQLLRYRGDATSPYCLMGHGSMNNQNGWMLECQYDPSLLQSRLGFRFSPKGSSATDPVVYITSDIDAEVGDILRVNLGSDLCQFYNLTKDTYDEKVTSVIPDLMTDFGSTHALTYGTFAYLWTPQYAHYGFRGSRLIELKFQGEDITNDGRLLGYYSNWILPPTRPINAYQGHATLITNPGNHPFVPNYKITEDTIEEVEFIGAVNTAQGGEGETQQPVIETYSITVTVTDESISPIEGASVTLNSETITTDAQGEAIFTDLLDGDYDYDVDAVDYTSQSSTVTVAGSDVSVPVTLIMPTYSIVLRVEDETATAIQGATVDLDGNIKATGVNGYITYADLINGTYQLDISADGYVSQTIDVTVAGDIARPKAVMVVATYSATITVLDEAAAPISGATVDMGGDIKTTNGQGEVVYTGLVSGTYSFDVSADGFVDQSSSITITGNDKTVDINLVEDGWVSYDLLIENYFGFQRGYREGLNIGSITPGTFEGQIITEFFAWNNEFTLRFDSPGITAGSVIQVEVDGIEYTLNTHTDRIVYKIEDPAIFTYFENNDGATVPVKIKLL